MSIVIFGCINQNGYFDECRYSGPDIEACFDTLSVMVRAGWILTSIELVDLDKTSIKLPIEAFDGELISGPLMNLRREWERILY